jgi:predicted XRE-type DNA-binding protein
MADLFMKKRHSFGSNSNLSKLTEDDVLEIKRLLHEPVTQKEIADRFVITPGNVSAIANGKSWNLTGEKIQSALHSKIEPCGSKNGSAKLCESNIPEIRNLLAQGIPQRKIAEVFEISQRIICLINQGKLWRHV